MKNQIRFLALSFALISLSAQAAAQPRIGLVVKSLGNEFFRTMVDAAKKDQAGKKNYDLLINGIKDEGDLAQQISLVEQLIAQKVDAIVIAPADSKALIPVCKRAMDAGVVVINIDNKMDDAVLKENKIRVPFVGPDDRGGAFKVGQTLARNLKPGDEVAILGGIPSAFNAQQRLLGFEEALKKAGVKIVSKQSAEWETAKANTVSGALLNEYPNLKAIVASNDNMALGAYSAVQAAGKSGKVLVVGYDNISAIRARIRSGEILATADQHGDQLGIYGIEAALSSLGDRAKLRSDRITPVDLVTRENIGKN